MFGGRFGWLELIILLVIILLVFGVGRITKVAGELGKGIRSFKRGISGEDDDSPDEPEEEPKK
jgi:sec-independent protein translocase protein TatA